MNQPRWLERLKEQRGKTLHVVFPRKIKNEAEVRDLFTGDFTVKLPRQPSKACHVAFSSEKEASENKKAIKNKTIDGKTIKIHPVYRSRLSGKPIKKKDKKVIVPPVEPDIKLTQSIFVSNIQCCTKAEQLKQVIPGCISVAMLKPYSNNLRSAIVRMESLDIATEYLLKKREWPTLDGRRLLFKSDTRRKHKKSKLLKIYDGES